MFSKSKRLKVSLITSTLVCSVLLLTACGGGGDAGSTDATTGGTTSVEKKAPKIPNSKVAKVYRAGKTTVIANEATLISDNDKIIFSYEMRNHRTKEIVDTSPEGGLSYKVGNKDVRENLVPKALNDAIKNSLVGETYWVYFPKGMEDLPDYLDKNDAYTVKYTVLTKG